MVEAKEVTRTKTGARARKNKGTESNGSILNWYLNEIHKIPMLDRDQDARQSTMDFGG